MRAIILFISSSGCGRSETVNLTIQDFINATSDYHHNTEIYNVLNELKDKQDIIPRWEICRNKTNKFYTTFTSPEAHIRTNKLPHLIKQKLTKYRQIIQCRHKILKQIIPRNQ